MGKEKIPKESAPEKLTRFGRNFNVAVGAAALAGAAIIPGPNVILATYGWFNMAQAAGFEWLRKRAKKKRSKKKS
jgi:hypothetical protein